MSTSLLAFFTLVEKRALPLLPADKTWRFQRIIDFKANVALLQLWDEPGGAASGELSAHIEMRETRHENGAPSFSGSVQSITAATDTKNFSFFPKNDADVERQAELVAEMLRRSMESGN